MQIFGKVKFMQSFFAKVPQLLKTNLKERQGFWRCNSSKTVCFVRGTVKLCFEKLGHETLLQKIGSLSTSAYLV